MNAIHFDRSVAKRIGSQFSRLLHRVARKARRRALADVWLVLEGDWGGQTYLSVPWLCIGSKARVGELLRAMNGLAWGCNGLDGTDVRLVRPRTVAEIERDATVDGATREEVATAYGFASWDAFVGANRLFVSGGMGGGRLVENRLWLHDEFLGRDHMPSEAQPLLDALRGATGDEVTRMNWPARAAELLDLAFQRA